MVCRRSFISREESQDEKVTRRFTADRGYGTGPCSYYADQTDTTVRDIQRNMLFDGSLIITVDGDHCVFTTNSVPNHDFNDSGAAFATPVSKVNKELHVPLEPAFTTGTTAISVTTDNGVFLNGVKLDLLGVACFGVGDGKIGCNNMAQPWRYDAYGDYVTNSYPWVLARFRGPRTRRLSSQLATAIRCRPRRDSPEPDKIAIRRLVCCG